MPGFFGKYRGAVVKNDDPLRQGRLQVTAPAVLGDEQVWALPAVPYAGKDVGLFATPPIGAQVWVEFEGGDPDHPIWSGCFWGKGELPAEALSPTRLVFKTEGLTLTIETKPPGSVTLALDNPIGDQPLKLEVGKQGLAVTQGSITLKLNDQALELASGGPTLTLKAGGIDLALKPAALKLTSSGVEASAGPAAVKVGAAEIELSNGAASVKLSPASVNLNNGALEVI